MGKFVRTWAHCGVGIRKCTSARHGLNVVIFQCVPWAWAVSCFARKYINISNFLDAF